MNIQPMLVIGANSLIGSALIDHWRNKGVGVVGWTRKDLDLSKNKDTWPEFKFGQFRSAVICAAVTDQKKCRESMVETRLVNVFNTEVLASILEFNKTFVVFLSSHSAIDPGSEYGRQKRETETRLTQQTFFCGIIRLNEVMHLGHRLVKKWIEQLVNNEEIRPFSDALCSPISLDATVEAIAKMAEEQWPGIYQLSSKRALSWAGIANRIAKHMGKEHLVFPQVADIPMATHYHLDTINAERDLDFKSPDPDDVIDNMMCGQLSHAC